MAGWLTKRLGNGLWGTIDIDNPDSPPSVTATVTLTSNQSFTRILNGQLNDTEEMRLEKPMSYGMGFEYVGVGPNGANTADLVWNVVRCEWIDSKKTRIQYRNNIAWDDRAIGW